MVRFGFFNVFLNEAPQVASGFGVKIHLTAVFLLNRDPLQSNTTVPSSLHPALTVSTTTTVHAIF